MDNTSGDNCELCAIHSYFDRDLKKCIKCDCDLGGVSNKNNMCDQVILNLKIYEELLEKSEAENSTF